MFDMFDWNGDGKLDSWEQTNKVIFLYDQTHKDEPGSGSGSSGGCGCGCGTILFVFIVLVVIAALIR